MFAISQGAMLGGMMGAAPHGCPQEAVNRMKYATLALSILFTVLAVESAAVKAESLSQPRSEATILLAQRHKRYKGFYRSGLKHRRRLHHRRFKKFPHHHFRHRTFRRYPGRFRRRPFYQHRFRRRFYPRFRRYPYFYRRYPRYYPYHPPSSLQIYIH